MKFFQNAGFEGNAHECKQEINLPRRTPHKALAKKALTIVLAGGRGNRLKSLTARNAKPAVPFAGRFRIVDFALSNCINSGFNRIAVLTQYCSESLENYITEGWSRFIGDDKGFISLLPAGNGKTYEGTADAIYKNLAMLEEHDAEWVLILAGDHIYKMDYSQMLAQHAETQADVTIPCIEVPRMEATGFGVMHVDQDDRIIAFLEKPANPPGMPDKPDMAMASMGIYIFNKKFLIAQLKRDAEDMGSSHDFGTDLIPHLVQNDAKVMAHRFAQSCVRSKGETGSYWRDVGTVDAYWEANMDIASAGFRLDDETWPIMSPQQTLPPAQFKLTGASRGRTVNSMVSPGCIISKAIIERSLLSSRVEVAQDSSITDSIVLPGAKIGRNVKLNRVIVDGDCVIPDGLVIGENADDDNRRFYRTAAGIVIVNSEMLKAGHA